MYNSTKDNMLTQSMQPDLFPVLSEIPSAKKNGRLGCQTDLTARVDSKLGRPRPSRPGARCRPPRSRAAGTAPRGRPCRPPAGRTPTGRPLRSRRPAARTPARGPRLSTPSAQEGGHWGNSAGGPGAHAIGRVLTNEVAAARRPHPRAPSATRRPPLSECKQEARSF